MGFIVTFEVAGTDLDRFSAFINEFIPLGVERTRKWSGGYYAVDVYFHNNTEFESVETALAKTNLDWDIV